MFIGEDLDFALRDMNSTNHLFLSFLALILPSGLRALVLLSSRVSARK